MKSISFKAPKGFAAPEDSEPGKPFDILATVSMGDDGQVTLQAVDGIEMASAESEDMDEASETPDEGDFLGSIESQFPV